VNSNPQKHHQNVCTEMSKLPRTTLRGQNKHFLLMPLCTLQNLKKNYRKQRLFLRLGPIPLKIVGGFFSAYKNRYFF